MDRRTFMKLAGAAGLGASLPLISPAIGLASLDHGLKVAQETRMMMGTLVSVTVLDPSAARAQQGLAQAFERMASLTPIFDRHQGSGPLVELNRTGRLDNAPREVLAMLRLSQRVGADTGGAFEVTVAPIIDLTRQSFAEGGRPPRRKDLLKALDAVGGLKVDQQGARLTKEGAAVTLDGVAKGLIVDQGLEAVSATGCKHALINAGGDLRVMGDRGEGRPWRVGVADPAEPSRALTVVTMTSGAMATSGNYQVFFDQEKLYHHIVNPANGHSPRGEQSASVRASSAMVADALSTACFVMRPGQAMDFLASKPGLEGMMITKSGRRLSTQGFTG
jgi:thiamine biosynthesis lipoprotein